MKKRLIAIASALILFFGFIAFWLYGPIPFFRDLWVTSAMTTYSRHWLATMFYSQETIDRIMADNSLIEPGGQTDPALITIPASVSNEIELIHIRRPAFRATLLIVHNPAMVRLALPPGDRDDGVYQDGAKLRTIVDAENALAGINGSGFFDEDGRASGGTVLGLVMQNGVMLNDFAHPEAAHIIGICHDNILRLGYHTPQELTEANIRDAVEFYPYLIVNGVESEIRGNGGWGLAPRTAIGQRADGAFLLLVADGRQVTSIGASMRDLQEIMREHGAVNAANLDGGSSSIMMYRGHTVSIPSATTDGRFLPNAFVVVEPSP